MSCFKFGSKGNVAINWLPISCVKHLNRPEKNAKRTCWKFWSNQIISSRQEAVEAGACYTMANPKTGTSPKQTSNYIYIYICSYTLQKRKKGNGVQSAPVEYNFLLSYTSTWQSKHMLAAANSVYRKIMEILQCTSKPDEVINHLILFNVCLVTAFVRVNLEGLQARKAPGAKSVWNRSASRFRHWTKPSWHFIQFFS